MRIKSSGLARGLANARPSGSATFANAPPPGLTRRANAPQLPRGGGGWAQVELTDALVEKGQKMRNFKTIKPIKIARSKEVGAWN